MRAPTRISPLSHTADVGFEIQAPTIEALFRGAAEATAALVHDAPAGGSGPPAGSGARQTLSVDGADDPALMRNWLRALLWWMEDDGVALVSIDTLAIDGGHLEANLVGAATEAPPIREIKGVTLHQLTVEPRDEGWYGRVIFDV